MRRRAVLGGLVVTAGCLSVPSADTDDSHPFAGETVTVRVDERTDSPYNLGELTERVLSFWESSSERYRQALTLWGEGDYGAARSKFDEAREMFTTAIAIIEGARGSAGTLGGEGESETGT